MLGKSRLWVSMAALCFGAVACADDSVLPVPMGPEVVPAAMPATMPGGAVAVRYWGEVDPKAGTVEMYPIHEGNLIYRHERVTSAVNYQYGTATQENTCQPEATCLPSIDTVRLFTDQNTVTYVEDSQGIDDGIPTDDDCYHNGTFFDNDPTCGGLYQAGNACTGSHIFCGNVQITSNVTFGGTVGAMPDVVLDIGNPTDVMPAPILGCRRNSTLGGPGGLCVDDGPAKVAAATSNFVPQIPPAVSSLASCSYCYGNKATAVATGRPALQHAVISGASTEKAAVNTNKTALKLTSGNGFSATFIVYYALPALNAPGAQITYRDSSNNLTACFNTSPARLTRIELNGGGFGPPSDCIADSLPGSCPTAGAPAANFTVSSTGSPGLSASSWSDTAVQSSFGASSTYGCGVALTTPHGSVTSDDSISLCPGIWRPFSSAGFTGVTRAGGGLDNNFAIVMGGLTNPTNPTATTNNIQVMALPRCASVTPSTATLTTKIPAGAGRWGAATTNATGGVYHLGGSPDGTTCSAKVFRFRYSGGTTGTITNIPDLPVALCGATAVTVFDTINTNEYVVVTGGLVRPSPRSPVSPAYSAADLAPQATYVFRPGTTVWTTFNGVGLQRWNMGGTGHKDATRANNKAIFVGGATSVGESVPAVTTTDILTVANGTPSFSAGPALPQARSAPAVAALDGNFYVAGGSQKTRTSELGEKRPYRLAAQPLGGTWTLLLAPLARQGSLLLVSAFDEAAPAIDLRRLIMIGGSSLGAPITLVEEYNP